MGWFSGGKKEEEKQQIPSLPQLPRLPELPELPSMRPKSQSPQIHQLPSFPNSPMGQKFSQNTIKSAVSSNTRPVGKDGDRVFEADDFSTRGMMPKPEKHFPPQPQVRRRQEIDEDYDMPDEDDEHEEEPEFKMDSDYEKSEFETPEEIPETPIYDAPSTRLRTTEPVFIRIDKFEASLRAFEKTKKQIADIEKNLKEISDLKKEEERELVSWQQEILKVKELIDKVERDIFSKLE